MRVTNRLVLLVAAALLVGLTACNKSEARDPDSGKPVMADGGIARVRWVGRQELERTADNSNFMSIWKLPASTLLQARILERVSEVPWRWQQGGTNALISRTQTELLQSLLQDLVIHGFVLEMQQASGRPAQAVIATKMPAARFATWEKNLTAILQSLSGAKSGQRPGGGLEWQLPAKTSWKLGNKVELWRAGDWTFVGFAEQRNDLGLRLAERLQKGDVPSYAQAQSNSWLQAELDLARLAEVFGGKSGDLPSLALLFNGNRETVQTLARVQLARPLPFKPVAWRLPTDLIHEPLVSFTAVQGLEHWIGSPELWKKFKLDTNPSQYFAWAQQGTPFLLYGAAAAQNATNSVTQMTEYLLKEGQNFIEREAMGTLLKATNFHGVIWDRVPGILPFLKAENEFVLAGFGPSPLTNRPPPPGTIQDVRSRNNLVYYDREVTPPRLEAWLYIGQLARLVFHREQLPADSLWINWFRAAGAMLGNSVTTVTAEGPSELRLERISGAGFTGLELHLLGEWVESRRFPHDLHSLTARIPKGTPQIQPPKKTDPTRR